MELNKLTAGTRNGSGFFYFLPLRKKGVIRIVEKYNLWLSWGEHRKRKTQVQILQDFFLLYFLKGVDKM